MTTRIRANVFCCCVIAIFVAFVAGCSSSSDSAAGPKNNVPASVELNAQRLTDELTAQGFEVSRGYFKLWTADNCEYTFERMGMCYGNNPAAPYVMFAVPPWPEEYVDPVTSTLWGPSAPGYIDVYRLDPREAIVILGQLPPPGAFFSEQTWLFTRQGTYNAGSDTYKNVDIYAHGLLRFLFATVPGNPGRIQSGSMLSNPNNNVVIERKSRAAFDQIRYFVITPDQFMDNAVRQTFTGIGVKDEDVFTEQIPSDMKTGLDQGSDDFTTAIRYAEPKDGGGTGTPSDLWRKNLPLVVLRVRDTRSDRRIQPYPPVVLETRTAVNELPLKSDLGSLLAAVGRKWEQPCANSDCSDRAKSFMDVQGFPAYTKGPLCREIGENCLLDNWDASYHFYGPLSLDNGEIYAVAGTLGTETGNAIYVGLGINQTSRLVGIENLSAGDLKGTANAYVREVSNTGKFFLYYFTRDCSDLKELTDEHCFELPVTLIPVKDNVALSIRDYIKPGTQRGPDSSFVLLPEVLQLQRP